MSSASLRSLFPRGLLEDGPIPKDELFELESAHASFAFREALAAGCDLIHDHTKAVGTLLAEFSPLPSLTTVHNDFTLERLEQYLSCPSHRFVSISDAQAERCPLRYLGTVYNGIEITSLPFREEKDGFLLFLGRLEYCKGAHLAVEAARMAGERLILAGRASDGRYLEELGLDGDRLRFVGEVSGRVKWDLLARAKALLFPVLWDEPFGLVVIEAMACGTPVLAFRRGAGPELVLDGRTGILLEERGGAVALASALSSLPSLEPRECRRWVEARFSADRMVESYLAVYGKLLRDQG